MARRTSGAKNKTNIDRDTNMSRGTESDVSAAGTMSTRDLAGRRTIVGVFDDRDQAEQAIRDLKDAGFSSDQIGVAMRDRSAQGELIEDTGTHAAEGAITGAVGGGILGGLTGLLIGIGALAIPGIGPVVAGGALATAFGTAAGTAVAGAGIGAAAGGIVGALVGMGVPEEEATYFESGFRSGGVLVSVNAENRAMEALNILERHGADTGSSLYGESKTSDRTMRGTSSDNPTTGRTRRSGIPGPSAGVSGTMSGDPDVTDSGSAQRGSRRADDDIVDNESTNRTY